MFVVSPWSVGGYVASETFDHTSILRFMEERFGVAEPNITPWRRAVCGDLTSAFDFARTSEPPTLPDTSGWEPADRERHPSYSPQTPATGTMPTQERGTPPARPAPYPGEGVVTSAEGENAVEIRHTGAVGAHFQARLLAPEGAPHSYTVGAGDTLSVRWPVSGDYEIHLHGPNGFFRSYAGTAGADPAPANLRREGRSHRLTVVAPRKAEITSAYAGPIRSRHLDTRATGGWYDLTLTVPGTTWVRGFAGHLENGRPSVSDQQLGA